MVADERRSSRTEVDGGSIRMSTLIYIIFLLVA
jgi:hypothetical protein